MRNDYKTLCAIRDRVRAKMPTLREYIKTGKGGSLRRLDGVLFVEINRLLMEGKTKWD